MTTLYSYTSTNNNTGLNWNSTPDNYAWSFTPTVTGTPNQLVLRIASIVGTPVGDFYIKADKTAASTTHASATGVTISAGTNTISLSGGVQIDSGTRYWVYFARTSSINDYPRPYNEYASPPTEQFWRSSSAGIDPNTRYDSGVKNIGMSMDINGTTGASSSIKSVNGLAYASVKSRNGLAVASIKSINSLA